MSQPRRRWVSPGEVVSVLLLLLALPAAGQVRVATIQEAIDEWKPETHLYVMGDMGLKDPELAELEGWLEDRHWTVLLVQDAAGQQLKDMEGVLREAGDAIEWGTGQGVARKPGFAAQVHPETGEPDGAILSIVLTQRALYYTGSQAQDSRGLGESVFQGNLDQWAIAALRNGMDIVSAVKDTVTNIDGQVTQAIGWEAARQREQAAAARDQHRRADPGSDLAGRARAKTVLFSILGLWLLGLLAWLAWLLNRRRRPVKQEAEALLSSWQTALDRKLEALFGELEQRVSRLAGPVSGDDRRFAGATLELARQIRADVGSLTILWTSARAVLEKAAERIRPRRPGPVLYNLLFPGNYRRGLALLRDEPVPFDPAEGLPRLFGGERSWREDLLGDLASHEPFRKSFEELMAEFHSRAARAAGAFDELEASLGELPPLLKKTHERIWQAEFQKDFLSEAGAGDGLFLVPALFSEALPAATEALTDAQGTAAADPVGSRKGRGAEAGRLAEDSWRLAGLCRSARSAVMPALQSAEARLRQADLPTGWIGEGLRSLSAQAAELAGRTAREAVSREIETLAVDLAAFQTRAERAVELSGRLAEARARTAAGEDRVERSREEMGTALGLAPELLLREEASDPSERLAEGASQAGEAEARLARGEVDEAAAALEQASRLAAEAGAIVDDSLRTFEARESAAGELRAETERIAALVPAHELVLTGTREAFAESALALGPGDEVHPGANGSVTDNAEEAREELTFARGRLDQAVAEIRAGRMLAAASLQRQVRGHQDQARFRLAEIAAKRARLDRVREDNRGRLAEMEERVAEANRDLSSDPRITPPTLAAFEEAADRVRTVRGWIDTGKEDPLRAEEELAAARNGLDRVEGALATADRKLHDDAVKGLQEARRKVDEIENWDHPYGVAIPGQPGVSLLNQAKVLLSQKRYADAREAAFAARSEAESALGAALAEVEQRRIEEEEEESRREREAYWNEEIRSRQERSSSSDSSSASSHSWSSSSSGSSSSSSSGSGSSGWSGSSSGSGSSGWSGSSSGSGKSGW